MKKKTKRKHKHPTNISSPDSKSSDSANKLEGQSTKHVDSSCKAEDDPYVKTKHYRNQVAVSNDYGRLLLWASAGQIHAGELESARRLILQALLSGVDRRSATRLLLGGAYTSIGRASMLSGRHEQGLIQLARGLNLGIPCGSALFLDLLIAEASRCSRLSDYREAIQRWQDIASLLGAKTPEYVYHFLGEAYSLNRYGFGGTLEENRTWGDRHKYDILAFIHECLDPMLYLEIGVDEGRSLVCARGRAIGIDPRPQLALKEPLGDQTSIISLSSDAFFREHASKLLRPPPELVFIDGMHLFEFALRDFMNVERYASPATLVTIDDIYPCHPTQATRRRRTDSWTGDVWKLLQILQEFRPDLTLLPLNASTTGLLLVAGLDPSNRILWDTYETIIRRYAGDVVPPTEVLIRQGAVVSNHPVIKMLLVLLKQARYEQWSVDQVRKSLREIGPQIAEARCILTGAGESHNGDSKSISNE